MKLIRKLRELTYALRQTSYHYFKRGALKASRSSELLQANARRRVRVCVKYIRGFSLSVFSISQLTSLLLLLLSKRPNRYF